jgi:signal transduction histidine kinase/ligand-binding sensor domain-containing protein
VVRGDVPRSHQAWSTEEGLPEASVHQVFQSLDGYLWLATEGGVARFDGSAFQVLRHETDPAFTSNDISAIAQDSSGTLWFGTAVGLVQSRGPALRRFSARDGLPCSTINSLASTPDGSLLVLTSCGLVRFDGATFKPLPAINGTILSMQTMGDGAVLLLTSEGAQRYERGAVTRQVFPSATPANSARDKTMLGLQFGPGGAVWTRSARFISVRLPGYERVLQTGSELPGRITALYVDRRGTGWIGTNRGLFSLEPVPKATVQAVDPLRAESILSIMEDREGNLWIGTETSGLHTLRPRKFRSEPAAAGEAVTAGAAASDGTLWFGTRDDGVRRIRNGVAEQPVPIASLTSPVILSMASGNHADVWVGTPDGLNQIAGKRVQQYTSSNGLPDDFVRSVLVDSRGTVWAGTRRGLARIEGTRITTLTHADGLGSDSIGPLLESTVKNSTATGTALSSPGIWVGTSAGLSHIQGTHIENFSPYQDPARDVVSAIAQENDGSLWVGLHGEGLSRFADGRFTAIHSAAIPSEIAALFVDRQGYLWLRGVHGVYHVALAQLSTCGDQPTKCSLTVANYGVADGMPSDATPAQGMTSIWQARDGELWFATPKGIAVADPAHLPVNSIPPPVVIEHFIVDESDVPLSLGDIQIGTGHNRYTFDYAALSYTLPSKNRFRYMLEGFDRNWIDAGIVRTASYTSLPPRDYRFRVQAQNNDGVWNETGAELRFHIPPPLYRRWWFYILAFLTIAGLAVAIFQLRLRAVHRRFALVLNERNRMAREIHDTLAQDFVSVSLQLDIASQMLRASEVEQATSQLEATRKLVKGGLEGARQSIWNLRANVAEGSLPTRLTALMNRYAETEHPPRLKIGGAYRKLAASLEDDVLRIAQESLVNAYRHSAATAVLVQLHYDPNALLLSVRDNGRGFSPATAQRLDGHYGLRGMQERATSLGATLTIVSSPEEGTTVTLHLPLAGKEDS